MLMSFLFTPLHKQYTDRYLLHCSCTLPSVPHIEYPRKIFIWNILLQSSTQEFNTYFIYMLCKQGLCILSSQKFQREVFTMMGRYLEIPRYPFHFSTKYFLCKVVTKFYVSNYLFQLEKKEGMYVSEQYQMENVS